MVASQRACIGVRSVEALTSNFELLDTSLIRRWTRPGDELKRLPHCKSYTTIVNSLSCRQNHVLKHIQSRVLKYESVKPTPDTLLASLQCFIVHTQQSLLRSTLVVEGGEVLLVNEVPFDRPQGRGRVPLASTWVLESEYPTYHSMYSAVSLHATLRC